MWHNKKPAEIRIFHHRFSDGRTHHHYIRQWKKLPPLVRLIIQRWKSQNASTTISAVIRSFHYQFVRTLNTTHFNPAVVNIYQLCIGVHVLNDLMALVLAVPNGERFIRSMGVWNSVHVRNDLTMSTRVNTTYYYWKFNYYRMHRSSQASYSPLGSLLMISATSTAAITASATSVKSLTNLLILSHDNSGGNPAPPHAGLG
jgi:hypothetical protein